MRQDTRHNVANRNTIQNTEFISVFSLRLPLSKIKYPSSGIKNQEPGIENQASRIQNPKSSIQNLASSILLATIFLLSTFILHPASAQVFPVQVNTHLNPPYTPYLNDYTAPGEQKLMVQIRLNDPTVTEYNIKLRIVIEGVGITIRTKPTMVPSPITIQGGGIPQFLYGEDLSEYFNPNNLDFAGISRREFEKTSKLPEGVYRFSIEVLDYNRSITVSNKATTIAWVILNDPPILNFPRNDNKVRILDPTNIPFTWTPRHTGSPNSAFSTEYIFKLVEVWPLNKNPYDAFLTQPILYETTVDQTQLIYGLAEPALIPGRKYAWQVQAKDLDGRDLFKNQGRSEVFVFQFGDALGVPENLFLQTANASTLTVRWEQSMAGTDATNYRVRYRSSKKGGDWYETQTTDQWKAIPMLQPDTEYEVQVRAEQKPQFSNYTVSEFFKTIPQKTEEFVCKDDVTPPPLPRDGTPVFPLSINDTIRAGGYDVLVREVTGSNGAYTGAGSAIVPWLNGAKIRVVFDKIKVNDRFYLTSGTIRSVWNADSKFLAKIETPIKGGNAPEVGEIDVNVIATDSLIAITGAAIVSVTKDPEGNIIVETSDGNIQKLPKGTSYSIVDEVGNGYAVDKEGNVAKTTATEAIAANNRGNRTYNIALRFEKGSGEFGFDEKKHDPLAQYYQQLDNGNYIAWKAVTATKSDQLIAKLEANGIDASKIKFNVSSTPLTPASTSGGTITLNVTGKADGFQEELVATYPDSDTSEQVLGKINLASYDVVTNNLVIVPVNNVGLPSGVTIEGIANKLKNIYGQAVAEWRLSLASKITVELGEQFDDGETGLLTNYTDDMKKVINTFGKLQDKTYYLFLVEKPLSQLTLGYMPRSKQAGFIFIDAHKGDNEKLFTTMAHELGHGAFNLKHTFSEHSLTQSTTDNLMDYNNGSALYKYQWDYIHDPQSVIGLFEEDEDGAYRETLAYRCIPPSLTKILHNEYYYHLNSKVVLLSQDYEPYAFVGTIDKVNKVGALAIIRKKSDGRLYYPAKNNEKYPNYYTRKTDGGLDLTDELILPVNNNQKATVILVNEDGSYKIQRPNVQDVVGKVDDCGCFKKDGYLNGQDGSIVFNFSSESLDKEYIQKLFTGNNPKIDHGEVRHILKVVLFITDTITYTDRKTFIETYVVPQGYVKLWLHKGKNGWEIKSELPVNVKGMFESGSIEEALGLNCPDKDSQGKSIYKLEDFNSPLQATFASLDYVATAYYELFDALGKGIRKLRIPDYAWNCNEPDKYQPAYAYVYRFITLPLSPLKTTLLLIGGEQLAQAVQQDNPELAAQLRQLSNGQAEFAFICGVWNGLIETIASVPDIGKYFYGMLSCQGRSDFGKFWSQLKRFEKEDANGQLECSGVWCALKTGFVKQFSGTCQTAEMGGEVAFIVIVSFVDPAACESLLGKGVSTAIKIIQYCDAFTDKFNPATWALRFSAEGVKILKRGTTKVFGRIIGQELVATTKAGLTIRVPMDKVVLEETVDGGLIARVTQENGQQITHELLEESVEIVHLLDEGLQKAKQEFDNYIRRTALQLNSLPFTDPQFLILFSKYAGFAIGKGVIDFSQFAASLPADIKDIVQRNLNEAKQYFDNLLVEKLDNIPADLATKLGTNGSDLTKAWLNGRTLKYKGLNKIDSKNEFLKDLEGTIGKRKVIETFEDTQGRLSIVLETDGVTFDLISVHKNVHGSDVISTYNRAYNQNGNTLIDVGISQNKLGPDYTIDISGNPTSKYLYPQNSLPPGKSPVVRIKMSGKRKSADGDFARANKEAGLTGTEAPDDYVWHHLDDFDPITGECTMQLVLESVHTRIKGMAHSGSVAQWKKFFIEASKAPNQLFYTD
jgi:hypothetical protein